MRVDILVGDLTWVRVNAGFVATRFLRLHFLELKCVDKRWGDGGRRLRIDHPSNLERLMLDVDSVAVAFQGSNFAMGGFTRRGGAGNLRFARLL